MNVTDMTDAVLHHQYRFFNRIKQHREISTDLRDCVLRLEQEVVDEIASRLDVYETSQLTLLYPLHS